MPGSFLFAVEDRPCGGSGTDSPCRNVGHQFETERFRHAAEVLFEETALDNNDSTGHGQVDC